MSEKHDCCCSSQQEKEKKAKIANVNIEKIIKLKI